MTTSLKILQEITTGYSIFEKDQVLTERQLNSVTDYLNDQTRLTRIYLLGVGIGSGLRVSLSTTEISVTQGMGITTDGDLLYYPNDTLFDRFTLYDTSQPKYAPFYVGGNINGTMLTVYELVRQSAVDSRTTLFPLSEFTPQTTKNLADMVAVLLMESYVNDPDLCTGTDCDNLGQDCINTIKLLLVEKAAINQLLHPAIATPDRAFKALNEIIVDRPLIPSSLSSASQLAQIYRVACTSIHQKILSELPNLYLNCATILGNVFPSDPTANWTSRLISINSIYSSDLGIQYYYDFLKDWVQTYHHFRSLLEGNTTWCCPDTNAFPKHLLLGNLVTNEDPDGDPNENRTGFYPSPLLNYHENSLEHAKFLARKLDTLIQTFQVPTASMSAPIRITPSLFEDQVLEQRAIPYYYSVNLTHPIHQQWNYDLHRRGMDTYNYSYNASTYLAQGGAANPLGSQLGQFSFFRIEGYLGQNLDTAVNAISQLIQSNNLPFSIQAAHLGTTTLPGGVDFQELLSQEPSLEHFGGVTRGGTLVLLADPNNGTVIADFLLPSLPHSPGSSTCTVMVKPSDNLAVVLGTIANGQDAHICLAEGTYNLSAQLRLENKGHLTISGNGKGTRIIAPGIETLFEFSNCKSISIRDCSLENAANQAGIPKGFANNLEDLRGLLTILNCPSVELEKLSLRCAHQAVRSASCITVRQNLAVANTQVRIRHCDLEVGYQQIGILLVNVERSQIEDNKIQVDRSNSFDTLNALAAQPQYRLRLLPRLVANAYLGTSIPSGGATRLRYNASNVTVSFSEQSLRWKSDLASDAWLGLLNAQNPLVQTRQDLLKAIKQLARQILLDDTFRSNHPIFNTWYQTLNKPGTIIASQGIVVAGSRAEEVRILNNTLQGFLQGIHIGISPRATYRAGSVLLSGNRIEVAAPIDQNQERHGIYVSSCDSLIIENNYLQAMGTFFQPIEGIRVSGRLGRMVIIRQNHLTGFSLGIYFNPLDTYGTATMMQWFVSDNMASGAQTFMRVVSNRPGTEGTQITSKVRVSNNFQ